MSRPTTDFDLLNPNTDMSLKRAYAPQTEYQTSTAVAACNFVARAAMSVTKPSSDHETENFPSRCRLSAQCPAHFSVIRCRVLARPFALTVPRNARMIWVYRCLDLPDRV